jgi:chromosome segregation ATPase
VCDSDSFRLAGSRSTSPHSTRRGSGGQDTLGSSGGITTDHIGDIVKAAVSNALEAAQQQWMAQLKTGNFSHPDLAGPEAFHHRFAQLVARVDVVQDQVQGLDAQALSLADKTQVDELQRLLIGVESRMSRLEDRMDRLEASQKTAGPEKEGLAQRLTDLGERMASLESSVETEHETSLDLLEVLLKQQQQQSQQNMKHRRESRESSRAPSPKHQRGISPRATPRIQKF